MTLIILAIHSLLLAWSATRHTPVVDEVGHFPAGLSHYQLRRFDLFNVNPPLVRSVATLPVYLLGVNMDLEGYPAEPGQRTESGIGRRWIQTHPEIFLQLFCVARWACIPFSLLGALVCQRWSTDLYDERAGFAALLLWCFSPTVLGHASLITPDAPAASMAVAACFVFWRWVRKPSLTLCAIAGILLGLTELTKLTWLFLYGLWPCLWLLSALRKPSGWPMLKRDIGHLAAMIFISLWVLNSGYLFEDSFQPLGKFQFFSQSLSGREPGVAAAEGGNRFRGTLLEQFLVPVPRNYVQGIDRVRFEYERGYPSYLRGVKRQGGWWYYYLYAMLVKMPVGTLLLIAAAALLGERQGVSPRSAMISRRADAAPLANSQWFEMFYVLAPAVCTLWLVSSQTGFNHHLRYVLPAFPFLFIFASRAVLLLDSRFRLVQSLPIVCMAWMIISSLSVYPHSLSYFNEASGGSINGWKHLDFSNVDWGQDLLLVKEWVDAHPDARPLYVQASGLVSPADVGIDCQHPGKVLQPNSASRTNPPEAAFPPGWYILGLTRLVDPQQPVHEFLAKEPADYIGYSMRIYHVK